ncbi:MAG: 50S ribosomal protein L35 [Planctomycetaceae bacterium]
MSGRTAGLAFPEGVEYTLSFPPLRGSSVESLKVACRVMPKQKTHKGMKKRYKVTAKGKVKHRKAFRGHLLSGKTSARKRHLRQDAIVSGAVAKVVVQGLLPSM